MKHAEASLEIDRNGEAEDFWTEQNANVSPLTATDFDLPTESFN